MKNSLLFGLTALLLAACSPTPPPAAPATPATPDAPKAASSEVGATPAPQTLMKWHWRLSRATDAAGQSIPAFFARPELPLTMDFTATAVSFTNTCNRLFGRYRIAEGKLQPDALASTQMACENPALQALDQAVSTAFAGNLTIRYDDAKPPVLTLSSASGQHLVFTGEPTAATQYDGHGETVFLEVAAATTTCHIPFLIDRPCPNVRELHYDDKGIARGEPGPWRPFADPIKGYTHEAGVHNVLRVKRYHVANAPAGTSSTAWVLDQVISTELPKAK